LSSQLVPRTGVWPGDADSLGPVRVKKTALAARLTSAVAKSRPAGEIPETCLFAARPKLPAAEKR